MNNNILINIPFCGFYNTLLDSEVDQEVDRAAEYQADEANDHNVDEDGNSRAIPVDEYSDILYRFADFSKCHSEIARKYVDHFNNLICEHLETVDVDLSFESMESPREYNFTTDRIFCHISQEAVDVLFDHCDKSKLDKTISDHLSSRSGFISHYGEFVNDWQNKPLVDWDFNELSMLLNCIVDDIEDFDLSIYYAIADDITMSFDNCVDWAKVERAVDDYLLEQKGEIVDARQFPLNCQEVKQYVDRFCSLNNLKN